ncbi:MAG: FixH family protein [Leptospiraceae bacterium]|nr:FixH family protein [Leptospiraceae bacterium]
MDKSLRYTFYGIIAIFLSLFVATYYTLRIAFEGHEGVVRTDYYEIGLNYNKYLQDQKALVKEGYKFDSKLNERSFLRLGNNPIEIKFYKNDTLLSDSSVVIKLERRATKKFDKTLKLQIDQDGNHRGEIDINSTGQWILTLMGTHDGKTLQESYNIDVMN